MRLIVYSSDITKLLDLDTYKGMVPNIGEEIYDDVRCLGTVIEKSLDLITQEVRLYTDY